MPRPTDMLWLSGLIFRPVGIFTGSRSEKDGFTEVVLPVGAMFGTTSGSGRSSGWARLDVNRPDPVEMTLAADLQRSALAPITVSSWCKYTGQFNMFVA